MDEIWVPVPIEGYSEFYDVSDHGRIRSHDRLVEYSSGVKHLHKGRVLAPQKSPTGYALVNLYKDKTLKTFTVHRIVATAFIPNPENLPQVNHKDFNKMNNPVSNLEWVTAKENFKHACDGGRVPRPKGEDHRWSRLSWVKVNKIRLMAAEGYSQYAIAEKFGISQPHVSEIVNYRKWIPPKAP